jgi:predicted dehydrogenase
MIPPEHDRRRTRRGLRPTTPPLRAGVIGAGNMGAHHARTYASLGGLCVLHGVFDVDGARARAVAQAHETRAYDELDALLEDVDVVTIASPSSFHAEHLRRALAAGVDVLVEKPLALTAADGRELLAEVSAAPPGGPIVQVGHIEHFNPAVGELRKLLAGEQLVALDIQRLSPFDGRITDADVVQDLMLHDIHVVLSLARAPLHHVAAVGRRVHSARLDDYAAAQLVFADGLIATLTASRATEEKVRRLNATTAGAHVTTDYLRRTIDACRWTRLAEEGAGTRSYRQESVVERIFVPHEEPLAAQLRSFLRAARDRCEPEVGVADGVRCLEVAEQIRRAVDEARVEPAPAAERAAACGAPWPTSAPAWSASRPTSPPTTASTPA